jgi:hypothetical protein
MGHSPGSSPTKSSKLRLFYYDITTMARRQCFLIALTTDFSHHIYSREERKALECKSTALTGTSLAIPLSLSMKEATKPSAKKKVSKDGKEAEEELNTEGLPPNATDEEGNILVTDYDIICGRGGLTNDVSF